MPEKVSVIITIYNRERYLSTAIESVLNQTYSDFELILWDDGSDDRSVEIAHHYAQKDKRICLTTAQHQGRSLALKAAHAQAQGLYVAWVDSDDFLAPTALEQTVGILEAQPSTGMVYTNYQVIDEHDRIQGLGNRCYIPYCKERLLIDFMTFHFRLMRRSLYEQVGGVDPSFLYAMDYDLCLKLSEVTEIYHLKHPLYYYRNHTHSISQQQRLKQIEWAQAAVNQALERRGLDTEYELDVELLSRFRLKRKSESTTLTANPNRM